jgi:hypothetical protein
VRLALTDPKKQSITDPKSSKATPSLDHFSVLGQRDRQRVEAVHIVERHVIRKHVRRHNQLAKRGAIGAIDHGRRRAGAIGAAAAGAAAGWMDGHGGVKVPDAKGRTQLRRKIGGAETMLFAIFFKPS